MRQSMNNKVILDASSLLALIQNETGAEIIKPLLKFSAHRLYKLVQNKLLQIVHFIPANDNFLLLLL